jgi:hypothetical protein
MSQPQNETSQILHCPLCGWGLLGDAYSSLAELRFSYDICECCGCEFGYDDNEEYYAEWVAGGMEWFTQTARPKDWTINQQLKNQIRPWPPT